MKQDKFNELLKSKEYKIISINYFPSYYTYYIRKLRSEKITEKDCGDLSKIAGLINLKCDDFYIKFDFKKNNY